eukprot:1160252-Pelagomonas_calceolata.AAC.17
MQWLSNTAGTHIGVVQVGVFQAHQEAGQARLHTAAETQAHTHHHLASTGRYAVRNSQLRQGSAVPVCLSREQTHTQHY